MNWKAFWNESPQVTDPDFCKQVGRTFRQVSFSENQLEFLTERLRLLLRAAPHKRLLDLACGNGLVTSRLSSYFEHVMAIDISRPLIDVANTHFSRTNIEYRVGDIVALDAGDERYDCALMSAAIQHLNREEVRRVLHHLRRIIAPGGCVVLGDVPDRDRIWAFYRGTKGKLRYGWDRLRGKPIIGSWWRQGDLHSLATEARFAFAVHHQPPELPNHYFRYDAVLDVPGADDRKSAASRKNL
jgi:SAM-dependent methyltransferase